MQKREAVLLSFTVRVHTQFVLACPVGITGVSIHMGVLLGTIGVWYTPAGSKRLITRFLLFLEIITQVPKPLWWKSSGLKCRKAQATG